MYVTFYSSHRCLSPRDRAQFIASFPKAPATLAFPLAFLCVGASCAMRSFSRRFREVSTWCSTILRLAGGVSSWLARDRGPSHAKAVAPMAGRCWFITSSCCCKQFKLRHTVTPLLLVLSCPVRDSRASARGPECSDRACCGPALTRAGHAIRGSWTRWRAVVSQGESQSLRVFRIRALSAPAYGCLC